MFSCLLLGGLRAKMAQSLKIVALFDLFHRLPIRERFSSILQKSQVEERKQSVNFIEKGCFLAVFAGYYLRGLFRSELL